MAVRFDDTTGERMVRTADVLDYNSLYTVSFWLYLVAAPPSGFWGVINTGVNDSSLDLVEINSSSEIDVFVSTPTQTRTTGSAITPGQWYHIFLVRPAVNSLKLYLNGVLDIDNVRGVGARAASLEMVMGAAKFGGSYILEANVRIANLKIWSADKTANLSIEANTILPKDFTNLYGYYPVFPGAGERARDYSGNVRDWTEVGVLTDESHPPVSYGV